MSMLSKLGPKKGARKKMKRIGRGDGSGHGGTSTKGHKGQKARSSPHITRGFEGGQMPLQRRSPKWGFTNPTRVIFNALNLDTLSENFENGAEVNPAICAEKGLTRRSSRPLKILGRGKLTKALKVSAHGFSASAQKSIEAAKGTVTVLQLKKPAA